jgi:tRNA-2-methylthio-N6-dimethylallyladenosine synthase
MPSFAITTFGCQMNVHDSERMREVLLAAGFVEASAEAGEHADVLVLNTCSVREKAEQKLRSEVGRVAKHKRTEPQVLVVAGCVAQQEGAALLKSCKGIDLIIGPDNIAELPRLLDDLALGGPPTVRARFDLDAPSFLTASGAAPSGVTAFVTTMKGCDERCSFCIVPTTRGPERYRPSREIVTEIAGLVARGAREVTLLGQTVNSYVDPERALGGASSSDAGEESEFAALLREIARAVPELRRLRYTSPHPRHLTPALVRAHAELDVLVRHVHLPVQSGSDRVLRRMIRRYDRAEYVARVAALRAAVPGVTLSTDVIVGFPGETDDDFEATLSLAREVGFTALFGFKYSPRPGTPALRLGDDVPERVKSARLARLFEESEARGAAHLASLVGTRQEVLVEGVDKHARGLWTGRSARNEIVHVAGAADRDLTGARVDVTIASANKHSVVGELDRGALAAFPPLARVEPRAATSTTATTTDARRSLPMVGA